MLEKKYKFDKWTSPLHIDEIERTVVYDDDLNVVEIRDENLSAEARKFHRDLTRQKKELARDAKYKASIESWKVRPWYDKLLIITVFIVSVTLLFIMLCFPETIKSFFPK